MNRIFRHLILLYMLLTASSEEYCPIQCTCKRNSAKDSVDWIKVRCGELEKIRTLDGLDFSNIAKEVVYLNLSENHLTTFLPKAEFIALQKLDLSKNRLSVLKTNQFLQVPNLRRLDISYNIIKHIEPLAFDGLKYLERLKLNQNHITTISKGTFEPLFALKQLDISNNLLSCDCELLWLLDWSLETSVKLVSNPKCSSPSNFKGTSMKKLKVGVDIHCKSRAGSRTKSMISLQPEVNQVVFEGDPFRIYCHAPTPLPKGMYDGQDSLPEPRFEWTWLDLNPQNHFDEISIENRFLPENGLLTSVLTISKLKRNHTGIWNCRLMSIQGNHSKGITLVVISDDTQYCPVEVTSNNKGSYTWPRTVVNFTVTMPCESTQQSSDGSKQKASYFCSPDGQWQELNTSECAYISETTKILEQFSKVNLTHSLANILESAKHFKNQSSQLTGFSDVMDLVFVARTIDNYVRYPNVEKELAAVLMESINKVMNLPATFISEAHSLDGSCTKMIKAVEILSEYAPPSALHKSNIATEQIPVKQDGFTGMTCTWYIDNTNHHERVLSCSTSALMGTLPLKDKLLESSVKVPTSVFQELDNQDVLNHNVQHIMVAIYKNNKFFPVNESVMAGQAVTSAVVGVKLMNATVVNLTEPVFVMLHNPPTLLGDLDQPKPVWWDENLNNGKGGWSTNGCQLNREVEDIILFSCQHLGYYGLLQNIRNSYNSETGAEFKLSHPAIYVGSFLLIFLFLIAIMTYLLCYNSIQMPKKAKHSLINMWIAISLLCFMYIFGIYQTETVKLCQAVGLILHYFTLCSLLWICVGVNYMYKRLTKNDTIGLQDDELPPDQPIQKPILGLYLVGWGVALIICGISGAVNMKEYASHSYCFLSSGPALSALIIPFSILLIFLFILFLLIRCAIYNVDTNGHLSEGTQATENVDLDLLEPNFPAADIRSLKTNSTKTASSDVEDPEHAPSAQLKAYMLFLFIFILTWVSCALATIQPIKSAWFNEDFFSIVFAILAFILGAFTVFFYCIARDDVRTQWMLFCRHFKNKNTCFRTRNVSDASPDVTQIQMPINNPLHEVHQLTSRSSSRSSNHTKTNSHTSNMLKAAVDLNGSVYSEACGTKINNVNLVVLHRQQYRSQHSTVPNLIENPTNTAEMFYNPHQITVARKFFKKQKRHMMKRNNLAPVVPRDINSDNTSVLSCPRPVRNSAIMDKSIFGTNAKVNNTNIHVEHVCKPKHRNPNILSDSCEEYEAVNTLPVENLVMNAERLRRREMTRHRTKKKQNVPSKESVARENNMRSVSQQCTLDYSSETISDSILDKTSPDKAAAPVEMFNRLENDVLRRENSPAFTEESHYCKIADSNITNNKLEPWCAESTTSCMSVPRIYVNPSHDLLFSKSVQSRTSSVSASELDELYQQIKCGPNYRYSNREYLQRKSRHHSPSRSDSEINVSIRGIKYRQRAYSNDDISDKIETTV